MFCNVTFKFKNIFLKEICESVHRHTNDFKQKIGNSGNSWKEKH